MIPYSLEHMPPAPALTVGISVVDRPDSILNVTALLDTAADISVVPDTLIDQLGLIPVSETMIAGFEERPVHVLVYVVAIHIAGARLYPARVVAHSVSYALIGRNVLNSLFVRLDGPDLLFQVMAVR